MLYRQSLLCTVYTCMNFSYHDLNNPSPPTTQFKFQLPSCINCEKVQKVQTSLLALQSTNHHIGNRYALRSVSNQVTSFKVCQSLVTVHIIQFTPRQQNVSLCCLLVSWWISIWHFTKLDDQNWKEGKRGNKAERAAKKNKAIMLEVKF